jgi:hypothetical protein
VADFDGSEGTVEPESSRRAAASSIHEAGDSAGAVGDVPANGSNTSWIRLAAMRATWTELEAAVVGAAVMIGVGAPEEIDTGDVVTGVVTLELDATSGVADGVSTTIWSAATVPFACVLSAVVEDDANELAAELADVDDDPTGFDVPCRGVASFLAASEARGDTVDVLEVLAFDEPWDVEVSSVPTEDWVAAVPAEPASGFGSFDVEVVLVADTEEVPAPDGELEEGCVDSELDDPLLVAPLPADAELDDESDPEDEDSPDAVSAHATPCPLKTAAPTPRATASPPTRPMYLEAPISFLPQPASPTSMRDTVARRIWAAIAMPTGWEIARHLPCR